ncbi:MAG: glutamine synthetase, partial [Proteobacteria bacterium]|nr:glutamine synthetase [Pseudomonadota bacterium]
LPKRLDAAIALFANSEVLSTYLGSAFTAVYTAMRQGESNAYHAQVPDVDYAWYLRAL